jgi:transcriptional regulator with XRE-family HTH domain
MAEDIKKEIQEENLVKKTCRELGITQKELANMLGITDRTISNWANNKVEIPKNFSRLIDLLRIEKDFNKIIDVLKKYND